jgi:hypothetical protein
MRNFTLLTILLVFLLGGTSLKAQVVTYSDDFSTPVDYLKFDFKTGIWKGFEFNSGAVLADQNSTVTGVNAIDGGLVFKTSNGGWEGNHDDGAYLYRTVIGGVDFEVQVKLVGGDFVTFDGKESFTEYNSAGILIRNPDHTKQNTIYGMFFEAFNIHSMIKTVVDGAQTELINTMDVSKSPNYQIKEYPYMKITRVGIKFTLLLSKDGKVWEETVSCERPDFEGVDLQVGVTQCNFWSGEAPAADYFTAGILDDFILTHDKEGSPTKVSVSTINNDVKAYSNQSGLIHIDAASSTIAKVSVYSISGKLVKVVNGLNAKNCNISMSQKGLYLVAVETSKGTQVRKVSICE